MIDNIILSTPISGYVSQSISYRQHIVGNPATYSKYSMKTPFIRVYSNAVGPVDSDKNKKELLELIKKFIAELNALLKGKEIGIRFNKSGNRVCNDIEFATSATVKRIIKKNSSGSSIYITDLPEVKMISQSNIFTNTIGGSDIKISKIPWPGKYYNNRESYTAISGTIIYPVRTGDDVKKIQNKLGIQYPDGIFGKGTLKLVKKYQSNAGISEDGIVGPVTWNVLFNNNTLNVDDIYTYIDKSLVVTNEIQIPENTVVYDHILQIFKDNPRIDSYTLVEILVNAYCFISEKFKTISEIKNITIDVYNREIDVYNIEIFNKNNYYQFYMRKDPNSLESSEIVIGQADYKQEVSIDTENFYFLINNTNIGIGNLGYYIKYNFARQLGTDNGFVRNYVNILYKIKEINELAHTDSLAKKNTLKSIVTDSEMEFSGGLGMYSKDKDIGIRPTSGVVSFSISTMGQNGALRRGKLTLKAFSIEQLETLQKLYVRPGINLFIEWGWSVHPEFVYIAPIEYDDNKIPIYKFGKMPTDDISIVPTYNGINFFDKSNYSSAELNTKIIENRARSFGHYDAIYGKVSNFNWSMLDDGSYDITVDITTTGTSILQYLVNDNYTGIPNIKYNVSNIFPKIKEVLYTENKIVAGKQNKKDKSKSISSTPKIIGGNYLGTIFSIESKPYYSLRYILEVLNADITGLPNTIIPGDIIDDNKIDVENARDYFTKKYDSENKSAEKKSQEYIDALRDYLSSNITSYTLLLKLKSNNTSKFEIFTDNIQTTSYFNRETYLTSVIPDEVIILNCYVRDYIVSKGIILNGNMSKDTPCFGSDVKSELVTNNTKSITTSKIITNNLDLSNIIYFSQATLKKIYEDSSNLDSLLKEIFNMINKATVGIVNLSYTIDTSTRQNFEVLRFYDNNITKITNYNVDEIFKFELYSKNCIIKNFQLSSSLPSAFQRAAFISASPGHSSTIDEESDVIKILDAFSGGYINNYRRDKTPSGNSDEPKETSAVSELSNIEEKTKKLEIEAFYKIICGSASGVDKGVDMSVKKGETLLLSLEKTKSGEFMKEFGSFYYRKLNKFRQTKENEKFSDEKKKVYSIVPVGINLTFSLEGLAGIYWGSLLRVNYLPLGLSNAIFYVTEITDEITDGIWTTNLKVLLRALLTEKKS